MDIISNSHKYGSEGQHPILKPQNSKWLVVDGWCFGRFTCEEFPELVDQYAALDIHWSGDDLTHTFLSEEAFEPFPNKKKLARWYNEPCKASTSLRLRRSRDYSGIVEIIKNKELADNCLQMAELIRGNSGEAHIVEGWKETHLEYYPDGHKIKGPQVWSDGHFWLRIAH